MYFWSLTSETNITCVAIAYFLFWLFSVDAFFQFWGCGIHMHIRIITRVQKGRICGWKEGHMLLLNVLLTMNFEHEGHLYANCLFCIFSFFIKCLLSQLSSRDIDMTFPFYQGFKLDAQIAGKTVIYWQKKIFLKFIFWDEGHLYPNCLFYILTAYCKCLLFLFLGCGIHMHIPILTRAQKWRISDWKHGYILLKRLLLKFNV